MGHGSSKAQKEFSEQLKILTKRYESGGLSSTDGIDAVLIEHSQKLFQTADLDKSGSLDQEECFKLCCDVVDAQIANASALAAKMEDPAEAVESLKASMKALRDDVGFPDACKRMFKRLDSNQDGKVSMAEFQKVWHSEVKSLLAGERGKIEVAKVGVPSAECICSLLISGHEKKENLRMAGTTKLLLLSEELALSIGIEGQLRLWNLQSKELIRAFSKDPEDYSDFIALNTACALKSGTRVVAGYNSGLYIFDYSTGEVVKSVETAWVCGLKTLDNGNFVSTHNDKTLRVWDPEGEPLHTMEENSWFNFDVLELLPDGNVITGSNDGEIAIWDCVNFKRVEAYNEPNWGSAFFHGWLPDPHHAGCSIECKGDCQQKGKQCDGQIRGIRTGNIGGITVFSSGRMGLKVELGYAEGHKVFDPTVKEGMIVKALPSKLCDYASFKGFLPSGQFAVATDYSKPEEWSIFDAESMELVQVVTLPGYTSGFIQAVLPDGTMLVPGCPYGPGGIWKLPKQEA